jgi:hypothetical protein
MMVEVVEKRSLKIPRKSNAFCSFRFSSRFQNSGIAAKRHKKAQRNPGLQVLCAFLRSFCNRFLGGAVPPADIAVKCQVFAQRQLTSSKTAAIASQHFAEYR